MKYFKYINSKGFEVGYGTAIITADEYGSTDVQNIEVPYEEYQLYNLKREKITLNDELRDIALLGGIIYKDILFDSDTDQKINLLSTVETLSDEDTIVWYSINNEPLLCNKEDLYNIGYLIKELTTYCWTHNAEIKQAIQSAETLEELEEIEINYNREEE